MIQLTKLEDLLVMITSYCKGWIIFQIKVVGEDLCTINVEHHRDIVTIEYNGRDKTAMICGGSKDLREHLQVIFSNHNRDVLELKGEAKDSYSRMTRISTTYDEVKIALFTLMKVLYKASDCDRYIELQNNETDNGISPFRISVARNGYSPAEGLSYYNVFTHSWYASFGLTGEISRELRNDTKRCLGDNPVNEQIILD